MPPTPSSSGSWEQTPTTSSSWTLTRWIWRRTARMTLSKSTTPWWPSRAALWRSEFAFLPTFECRFKQINSSDLCILVFMQWYISHAFLDLDRESFVLHVMPSAGRMLGCRLFSTSNYCRTIVTPVNGSYRKFMLLFFSTGCAGTTHRVNRWPFCLLATSCWWRWPQTRRTTIPASEHKSHKSNVEVKVGSSFLWQAALEVFKICANANRNIFEQVQHVVVSCQVKRETSLPPTSQITILLGLSVSGRSRWDFRTWSATWNVSHTFVLLLRRPTCHLLFFLFIIKVPAGKAVKLTFKRFLLSEPGQENSKDCRKDYVSVNEKKWVRARLSEKPHQLP